MLWFGPWTSGYHLALFGVALGDWYTDLHASVLPIRTPTRLGGSSVPLLHLGIPTPTLSSTPLSWGYTLQLFVVPLFGAAPKFGDTDSETSLWLFDLVIHPSALWCGP